MMYHCQVHGGVWVHEADQVSPAFSASFDKFNLGRTGYRFYCIDPDGNAVRGLYLDRADRDLVEDYIATRQDDRLAADIFGRNAVAPEKGLIDRSKGERALFDRVFIVKNRARLYAACRKCLTKALEDAGLSEV